MVYNSSPKIAWVSKSTRIKWAGHVARMEEGRSSPTLKILTGNRVPGKPRCSREDNSRVDPEEIDVNTRKWINWTHDQDFRRVLVDAALDFRIP